MTDPEKHFDGGEPLRVSALVSTLMASAVVFTIALFAEFGHHFVPGLEDLLGDVLLERAIDLERAGDRQLARETYSKALAQSFNHNENRAEALVRLGNLTLWDIGAEEAIPILEEAYEQRERNLFVFEPLIQAYIMAGNLAVGLERSQEFYLVAEARGEPVLRAKAKLFEGRILAELGQQVPALEAHKIGDTLVPGRENAYFGGVLAYELGEFSEAERMLDSYLQSGSGENAAWARELLSQIEAGDMGGSERPRLD